MIKEKNITKGKLEEIAKIFNGNLLEKEDALPTGRKVKKEIKIKDYKEEITDCADQILTPEDKDLFSDEQIEIMYVMGVDTESALGVSFEPEDGSVAGTKDEKSETKEPVKEPAKEPAKETEIVEKKDVEPKIEKEKPAKVKDVKKDVEKKTEVKKEIVESKQKGKTVIACIVESFINLGKSANKIDILKLANELFEDSNNKKTKDITWAYNLILRIYKAGYKIV